MKPSLIHYPADVFFDIVTLVNVAQPERILLLSNHHSDFLNDYVEQKQLLQQHCTVQQLTIDQAAQLSELNERFDLAIAIDWFEHLHKTTGEQHLARLRDVLCPQYCVCLPLTKDLAKNQWQLTDLFSFALSKVADYNIDDKQLALFKYNIDSYKKTPDWLNADNWANPQMWGKYWW